MYSSHIDSEGVWKLDKEEKWEKRRKFIEKKELKMAVDPESKEIFDSAGVVSSKISFFLLLSEWNGKFYELVKSSIKRKEDKADKKDLEKKYGN